MSNSENEVKIEVEAVTLDVAEKEVDTEVTLHSTPSETCTSVNPNVYDFDWKDEEEETDSAPQVDAGDGIGAEDEGQQMNLLARIVESVHSGQTYERRGAARQVLEVFKETYECCDDIDEVISVIDKLVKDGEQSIRCTVMEQLPEVAIFCSETGGELSYVIFESLLPYVIQLLLDYSSQVRSAAQTGLLILLERKILTPETVQELIFPVIFNFSNWIKIDEDSPEIQLTRLMGKLAPLLGKKIVVESYLLKFCYLCEHTVFQVRKVCSVTMADIASVIGPILTERVLLPRFLSLCEDEIWAVRNGCAEIFASFGSVCCLNVRRKCLAPVFISMLQDGSNYVRMTALQSLGPLIATFGGGENAGGGGGGGELDSVDEIFLLALRNSSRVPSAKEADAMASDEKSEPSSPSKSQISKEAPDLSPIRLNFNGPDSKNSKLVKDNEKTNENMSHHEDEDEDDDDGIIFSDSCPGLDPKEDCDEIDLDEEMILDSTFIADEDDEDEEEDENLEDELMDTSNKEEVNQKNGQEKGGKYDNYELRESMENIFEPKVSKNAPNPTPPLSPNNNKITNGTSSTSNSSNFCPNEPFNTFQYWRLPIPELDELKNSNDNSSLQIYFSEEHEKNNENYGNNSERFKLRYTIKKREKVEVGEKEEKNIIGSEQGDFKVPGKVNGRNDGGGGSVPAYQIIGGFKISEVIEAQLAAQQEKESREKSYTNLFKLFRLSAHKLSQIMSSSRWSEKDKKFMPDFDLSSFLEESQKGYETHENVPYIIKAHGAGGDKGRLLPPLQKTHSVDEQTIVPPLLLFHFLNMSEGECCWSDAQGNSAHNYCAYYFPAIVLTLGAEHWAIVRECFERLALMFQWKIRYTLAACLHEIAKVIGPELAERDLVPFYNAMTKDIDEVRIGVLMNLANFVQILKEDGRLCVLDSLNSFLKTDNKNNWRFRYELANQLKNMSDIYEAEDVFHYLCPISIELVLDPIADVRKASLRVICRQIQRLFSFDGKKEEEGKSIVRDFIERLIQVLSNSTKWVQRQSFALLASYFIEDNVLSPCQFATFILPHLLKLSRDKVPNVRLIVAQTLSTNVLNLEYFSDPTNAHHSVIMDAIIKLQSDTDPDVRFYSLNQPSGN